jgi:hypothetical protein
MSDTCFCILFASQEGERLARTVVESLRAFGGSMRDCPVWAFVVDPNRAASALPGIEGVERFPLEISQPLSGYPFTAKVAACAQAEQMAEGRFGSLVWLSLDCLIVNPPVLFDLGLTFDAAFRPVHHRNIGSLSGEPPDAFWTEVFRAMGMDTVPYTVESFVDSRSLRAYFNTHCFSIKPATGLCRAWWERFQVMATDEQLQAGACADEPHRVFLHQAILSALVAKTLPWERVRILPPEYNYPLNLLSEMPSELRVTSLNSLVNAVFEDRFPWSAIEIDEPLRSWLEARVLV